jgi:ATP/ADP translocase
VYGPRQAFSRLVDVRKGEWRAASLSFVMLLLASAAYTVLETARDALLLIWLPRRSFGVAYLAVAACALPAAAWMGHLRQRWTPRGMFVTMLAVSAAATVLFVGFPLDRVSVVALYVTAALIASALFPQFWLLAGTVLTLSQSRRLFGPIASASVVGAVAGSALAAALLPALSIRALLLIAAAMFVAAGLAAMLVAKPPTQVGASRQAEPELTTSLDAFRREPFLFRVALLVALTAATALAIDYFFKWTVARAVPEANTATFIARYYAVMNGLALVMQIFWGSAIVRRLGVGPAMLVTPFFSLVGGVGALIAGAVFVPVLILKAADGSLRSSIHRLTTEFVYLSVSSAGRERAKPLIDGPLVRVAQAITAGGLLALGTGHMLSSRLFAALVVALALLWLITAVAMQVPYLGQLRRATGPALFSGTMSPDTLDVAGAELLVEHLGSDDPVSVVAAMNTLARRGRQRLIPALVLRHDNDEVIARALEIFGATSRTDWYTLANRLLEHPHEGVRLAAARALASQGKLDAQRLALDTATNVGGYATLHAALADGPENLLDDPRVTALLGVEPTRRGLLAAIADAPASRRVSALLIELADTDGGWTDAAWTELLARATVRHRELRMIPRLVARLIQRAGREAVRSALVALGEPALEEIMRALDDPSAPRALRVHLPMTLARFGTKWAADKLLECIEHERDGRVRYRAIRALERLVVERGIRVDRVRVERLVAANLVANFKLLDLRVALGAAPDAHQPPPVHQTYQLLSGLLDDKLRQTQERAFHLLKIAHPKEDLRRLYLAHLSSDKRARGQAGEFLDALLYRHDERPLRELIRLLSDDLSPGEQVARAAALLGFERHRSVADALRSLRADADAKLATFADLYTAATEGRSVDMEAPSIRQPRSLPGRSLLDSATGPRGVLA